MAGIYVIKGAVEAAARDAIPEPVTIVLREKQARRFTRAGVTEIKDKEQKLARLARKQKLDRPRLPVSVVHWSFDEPAGRTIRADDFGQPLPSFDAQIEVVLGRASEGVRTQGRSDHSLRFDGQATVQAALPALTAEGVRTVAFWLKLPADTQLSDAAAIVSWRTKGNQKLKGHGAQISWNHNRAHGVLGALRTEGDFGVVVGSTPWRDGQWHHIAVVFVPADRAGIRWAVEQYVDGRLEDVTSKRTKLAKMRRAVPPVGKGELADTAIGRLWLGRRLGKAPAEGARFRGELDELFIADLALTPQEINRLMKFNRPPGAELVATKTPAP